MTPKGEQFILEVRQAARSAEKPTVITSSGLANPEIVSKILHRSALWLTPKVVESYDAADFHTWPAELQESLTRSVENFRSITETIPPDKAANAEQFARGEEAFRTLVGSVRAVVLWEWTKVSEDLITNTESWAREFGWITRRVEKRLSETLLGSYTMSQMLMHAPPYLYALDPVARFVAGAAGAFDLSIQPSYYMTSLYRDYDGVWYAHYEVGQAANSGSREPWNRDTFRKCVEELRALL
jgi:hypothetical protein